MNEVVPEHRTSFQPVKILIAHVEGGIRKLPRLAKKKKLPPEVVKSSRAHLQAELAYLKTLPPDKTFHDLGPEAAGQLAREHFDKGFIRNFIYQGLSPELAEEELAKRYKGVVTKFRLQEEGVIY